MNKNLIMLNDKKFYHLFYLNLKNINITEIVNYIYF